MANRNNMTNYLCIIKEKQRRGSEAAVQTGHSVRDLEAKMTRLEKVRANVTEFRGRVAPPESTVKSLRDKIDDLQNKSQGANVITLVPSENERETPQGLRDTMVCDMFSRKLGVSISSAKKNTSP